MSSEFRATVQSLFMLFLTATKLIVGWMYDRFGLPAVMAVCPISAVIAFRFALKEATRLREQQALEETN